MAVREFPALGFDPAPGDPASLGTAARAAATTATTLTAAADTAAHLTSTDWIGDAADAFRTAAGMLPRDLTHAAHAHSETAAALTDYADALATLQARAADLERQAADARTRQEAAVAVVNRIAASQAPSGSTALADLQANYATARATAQQYSNDLTAIIRAARQVAANHADAAQTAARRIRAASDAPYKQPSWLSRAKDKVRDWISDHADTLQSISGVLKSVSAVLGVLSFVPGLQWLAPIAMAAAGLALGIDAILKVTTGKGSWTSIGVDAALTFLPMGKVLKLAKRSTSAALHALGPALHAGNATHEEFRTLFGALEHVNRPRLHLGWAYQNNCQDCVIAVDRTLAGHPRVALPCPENPFDPGRADRALDWDWPGRVIREATTDAPDEVGSYEEITGRLTAAGDGSRGVVHGYDLKPSGEYDKGHVFNVVNRRGVIYYIDGQTGTWAELRNYQKLELLMGL